MLDCRYHNLCSFMDDVCDGELECPKREYCYFYEPMPDTGALIELADEMDSGVGGLEARNQFVCYKKSTIEEYARRMREACGRA